MKNKRGFTLIEIIIVVVLIVTIATISIVTFSVKKQNINDEEEEKILSSADVYFNALDIDKTILNQNQEMYIKVSELIERGLLDSQSLTSNNKNKCVKITNDNIASGDYELTDCVTLAYIDVKFEGNIKYSYVSKDEIPKLVIKPMLFGNTFLDVVIKVNGEQKHVVDQNEIIEYEIQPGDKNISIEMNYKTNTGVRKTAKWVDEREYFLLLNTFFTTELKTNYCYTNSSLPMLKIIPKLSPEDEFTRINVKVDGNVRASISSSTSEFSYQIRDGDKNLEVNLNYKNKDGELKSVSWTSNEEFNVNDSQLNIVDNNINFQGNGSINKLLISTDGTNYTESNIEEVNSNKNIKYIKLIDNCNIEKKYELKYKESDKVNFISIDKDLGNSSSSSSDHKNYIFKYIFPNGTLLYTESKNKAEYDIYYNAYLYNPISKTTLELGSISGINIKQESYQDFKIKKINAENYIIYRTLKFRNIDDNYDYLKYQIFEYNISQNTINKTHDLSRKIKGISHVFGSPCRCTNEITIKDVIKNETYTDKLEHERVACNDAPRDCIKKSDANDYYKYQNEFSKASHIKTKFNEVVDIYKEANNLIYSDDDGIYTDSYEGVEDNLLYDYFRIYHNSKDNTGIKGDLNSKFSNLRIYSTQVVFRDEHEIIHDMIWYDEEKHEKVVVIYNTRDSKEDIGYLFLRYKNETIIDSIELVS